MLIRDNKDRDAFIEKAMQVDLSKGAWVFEAKKYKKDRSLAQNRLSFKWYSELGKHSGNGSKHERNYCKFTYGCEILARDDEQFAAFFENLINSYDYEACVDAMDFIQVTSLFNVKQFTEYLECIERYAGENGWILTHPVEYDEAMY